MRSLAVASTSTSTDVLAKCHVAFASKEDVEDVERRLQRTLTALEAAMSRFDAPQSASPPPSSFAKHGTFMSTFTATKVHLLSALRSAVDSHAAQVCAVVTSSGCVVVMLKKGARV